MSASTAACAPARTGGFAPIESHGVVGDGKSAALVAHDGAIDWWAVPALDSPPLFAAVLDPCDGGCFTLEPAVPYRVSRRHVPGTNVLETTFSTRKGKVRAIDSLNQGADGPLPRAELARASGRTTARCRCAGGWRRERSFTGPGPGPGSATYPCCTQVT